MSQKKIIRQAKQAALKQLFQNILKGSYVNIVLSIFVFVYFRFSDTQLYILNYWIVCVLLFSALRISIASKALTSIASDTLNNYYHKVLFIILILTGCLWGGFYVIEFHQMSLFQNLFCVLLLNGASTIAIVSLSNSPMCYFGFVTPTILPTIIINAYNMQFDTVFLAMGICIFNVFVILIFFKNRVNILEKNLLMQKQQMLIHDLKVNNHQLKMSATTDDLTGLANRRQFNRQLSSDWQHAKRTLLPISLLIIDIDYFKQYNDKYGHLMGDECLRNIAHMIEKSSARQTDLATRFGGDEFALILYDTDAQGAMKVASKLMESVKEMDIPHETSPHKRLTVSIGLVTIIPDTVETEISLIEKADKALYKAKNNGRNHINVYSRKATK